MFTRFDQHYFDLLWAMTMKEFTVRYKQAAFGFLWIILNPLLQMVIVGTIFSHFMKIPNYYIFLFCGLLPWQFVSLTLTKVTPCFVFERNLLQKAVFPRDVIPMSIIVSNSINYVFSLIILCITSFLVSPFGINNIWMLIPSTIWLISLTSGCALLFSSLNVRFRDVAFFVQTLLLLWFYASPILYAYDQLPAKLQSLMMFNPLTYPLSLVQVSLAGHGHIPQELLIPNLLISAAFILIGIGVFNKESAFFSDWL